MSVSVLVFFVSLALSFYGAGLIWAMELDVFRGWLLLRDADELERVRTPHWRRLPYYVFLPIGLLLVDTVVLVWVRPATVSIELVLVAIALQVTSHVLTAAFWGPWQARIAREHQGPGGPDLARIVRTHWIRTALVTANALVLGWAGVAAFQRLL